jgi:branched-chain amino acid transport system substrate-binding protein
MKKKLLAAGIIGFMFILGLKAVSATEPVKIGLVTDLSGIGSAYGATEVNTAKMAVEKYGNLLGAKITLLIRDHHYNPGLAVERAKELYEREKVDVIVGCPQSAAALAVSDQALKNKKLFIVTGAATVDLVARNRYTIKYGVNDYMLAAPFGSWGVEHLGKKWYTFTADYVAGHTSLKIFLDELNKSGGEHVGNDMIPVGTPDFSPYVLKAMKTKPDAVFVLSAGKDSVNAAKAANEYGLKKQTKVVHVYLTDMDIKEGGIDVFAGNYCVAPWVWTVDNPGAREFADKYYENYGDRPPYVAAAVYSAIWQYAEAVKRAGTKETVPVIKALEDYTFRDFFANPGHIRGVDHLQTARALLLRVRKPEEVKDKLDFFEIVGSLPADKANPGPEYFHRKMGDF